MIAETDARPRRGVIAWLAIVVAAAGLAVVGRALLGHWGGVTHGHPAFAIVLALTALACLVVLWRSIPRRPRRGGWRRVLRFLAVIAGAGGVALVAWLTPYSAVEPALEAMQSDSAVTVTESPTNIVLAPTTPGSDVGLFFQPGALVDPRAYAAVLRPVAEAGHTVVIVKQPLGIAFLAVGGFDTARSDHPQIDRWVIGGHSLGGTVASMEADTADTDSTAPAVGLLLFASYPASDISTSLTARVESISGSRDGLATPEKIDQSRALLPAATEYVVIDGGSHAQFGDYGLQVGDNSPTISHADARSQISAAAVAFLGALSTENG